MEIKKYSRKQLENFSKIFFQIGLAFTLFVIYVALEHKTYEKIRKTSSLVELNMVLEPTEDIPIVKMQKIEPTQTIATPLPSIENLKVVEDNVEVPETIIESTETNENEAVTNAVITTGDIVEVVEREEIIEDVPFVLIEDVPVFPGCEGNNKQLKACFTKKVTEFFGKRFDVSLASELGLLPGEKKIFVVFKIDRTGKVTNVIARAPHPRLEKEVVDIISTLPIMTPGKQRGAPVIVSYSLPITFLIIKN